MKFQTQRADDKMKDHTTTAVAGGHPVTADDMRKRRAAPLAALHTHLLTPHCDPFRI